MKQGFTLLEVLIVVGIIVIIIAVGVLSLSGYRNRQDLNATAERVAAVLRDAQGRAQRQASSSSWGVHFDNTTTTTSGFYALFFGNSYSPSSTLGFYRLPNLIAYATSTVPANSSTNIIFTQLTGAASASTSITFLYTLDASASATVSVASSGEVSY